MIQEGAVVITGPTGAIGTALIELCIHHRQKVYAIVNPNSKRKAQIPKSEYVKMIDLDLSDLSKLPSKIGKDTIDVFFHLGWCGTFGDQRNDVQMQSKNVAYSLSAVKVAKKLSCKTFVFAGSQAEYGRSNQKLNAQTPTHPENEYGKAKLKAGHETKQICDLLGINHIYSRILSVYGPNDGETTMISSVIRMLSNNETPLVTKGEQQWDYLYSSDAADALYLLSKKGKTGKIYCIGSGRTQSIKDYISEISKIVNPKVCADFGAVPYRQNQVMFLCADISDLTKDTGFIPQVSFHEGIEKTLQWRTQKYGEN